MGISTAAENSIMPNVNCLLYTGAKPTLFSKDFRPTDWLSKISKGVQPLLLSASKNRLKIKGNATLDINIGDLSTNALFTAVRQLAIDVLLGPAFIDEHILAILPDE